MKHISISWSPYILQGVSCRPDAPSPRTPSVPDINPEMTASTTKHTCQATLASFNCRGIGHQQGASAVKHEGVDGAAMLHGCHAGLMRTGCKLNDVQSRLLNLARGELKLDHLKAHLKLPYLLSFFMVLMST